MTVIKYPATAFSGAAPVSPAHQDPIAIASSGPAQAGDIYGRNGSEPAPDSFEQFWQAYPRKERWRSARDLFETLTDGKHIQGAPTAEQIIEGAKAYASHAQRESIPFTKIMLPTTWLLEQGWRSVYALPKAEPIKPVNVREMMTAKAAQGSQFAADWLKRNG